MATILTTTSSFGKSAPYLIKQLESKGFTVVTNPHGRKLTEEEIGSLLQEHKPIGLLAGTEPITGDVIKNARNFLKVISRVGVGWDNVDRQAARQNGMIVTRTEGVLDQAVAELTLGMILSALRNISIQDRCIRDCTWEKRMGGLLQGKTVGVIGFGAIGQKVAKLASAFEARVVYYDTEPKVTDLAQPVDLNDLLAQAHIITIHASGAERILGQRELKELCQKGVIIVNTSRGGLVDEDALEECLKSGQVGFACLDVFENEPYAGPLAQLENVILTPHIGSYAQEARIRMEELAVSNLLDALSEPKPKASDRKGRQAFFFDFDGVVADSVEVKTSAFAKLFEEFGPEIQAKVVEHHRNHGGMTRREKFKHYYAEFLKQPLNDEALDSLCERFSDLVMDDVVASPEISGFGEFIKQWQGRLPFFIISATPDDEIVRIVGRRGLGIYFREVLGSSSSKKDNLQSLLDRYGFDPEQCVFFGDAESDYRAAVDCGVNFIGILPGPDAPLLKAAPDIEWVSDFKDIEL